MGSSDSIGESSISRIFADHHDGAPRDTMERILPLVYDELRALARGRLRDERPDHTLQTTALVHEAYLRLLGDDKQPWSNRRHFFHAAGEAMRRILIEHARKRGRAKRGGNRIRVELGDANLAVEQDPTDLLALDDAFQRMEEQDPRAAEVVRLRFFAGLTIEETAKALELSERTVKREWTFARAYLYAALRDEPDA